MSKDTPKPREDQIYTTTRPGTDQISIVTNGKYIIFGDDVESGYCEQTYDRVSGKKKVVTQVHQQSGNTFFFDSDNALLQYSTLFSVDTNTRTVHGQEVSMVGVVSVEKQFVVDCDGIAYVEPTCTAAVCLEYVGVKPPKENFGWGQAMHHLAKNDKIKRYIRVGMIVDSDLDNLYRYNRREKPFLERLYMPHNITLIYASGDTGSSLANKLLSQADRVANKCLIYLETKLTSPRQGRVWHINYVKAT